MKTTIPEKKLTLTQSEGLKIGQRGEYLPTKPDGNFAKRCDAFGIKCWIEKRKPAPMTESEKALRGFIDLGPRYELVYGITFDGKDFDCGDMPRDLGTVTRGIEIGKTLSVA